MTDTNITELRPSPHKGEGRTSVTGRARPAKTDRTNAQRQRRFKERRRLKPGNGVTGTELKNGEPVEGVTIIPSPQLVTPPRGSGSRLAGVVAAFCLATVGVGLSAIGMVETAAYALAVGGALFCALAIAGDVLTLTVPSVVGTLWHRRSPAVALAGVLWCAGAAVTVANLAGYVGEHVEQYQAGREMQATGRTMAMDRLARLKDERKAIRETRPPAAITAALNDARRSERPALREALAIAKRRDALDIELAGFEQHLGGIPQVATADASAAVLSEISGMTISERELGRLRLALLLGLPLCGGLVLSLAFALMAAASARRTATA